MVTFVFTEEAILRRVERVVDLMILEGPHMRPEAQVDLPVNPQPVNRLRTERSRQRCSRVSSVEGKAFMSRTSGKATVHVPTWT